MQKVLWTDMVPVHSELGDPLRPAVSEQLLIGSSACCFDVSLSRFLLSHWKPAAPPAANLRHGETSEQVQFF